ncbi:hypothetical protein BH09BAC6_BH09BAC6_28200 [soil metagenome]|jgi:hypothetical protein
MVSKVVKLLKRERTPWLLTLLVAVVTFQFNYALSGIFKVPVVAYSIQNTPLSPHNQYLQVTNISSDQPIKDLDIQLRLESAADSIQDPELIPIAPATLSEDKSIGGEQFLQFHIDMIQPGLSYKCAWASSKPAVKPFIYFKCSQTIKFEQQSVYTWLLFNHLYVNGFLMLVFIVIIILYLFKITPP